MTNRTSRRQMLKGLALATVALLATRPAFATEPPPVQSSSTSVAPGCLLEITNRVGASQSGFVYKDHDSPFNRGFASGKASNSSSLLNQIVIDTACVPDDFSATGSSTDVKRVDRVRGTVFRLVLPAMPPGTYAGFFFSEPEIVGQTGVGYNLTGATEITFLVRSPSGANVQFGVANRVAPYQTIPAGGGWQRITLPLASLTVQGNSEPLTNVKTLFSVFSNDVHAPNSQTLLFDDIEFRPVPTAFKSEPSLPLSFQTFGVVTRTSAPYPADQVLKNVSTVYDCSICALVLADAKDHGRLRKIADALLLAMNRDLAAPIRIPRSPDGARSLHDGYYASYIWKNNQGDLNGPLAGQVKLAGFYIPGGAPPQFKLVQAGATAGNASFALMMFVQSFRRLGDQKYLNAARELGRWIQHLKDPTVVPFARYGGYFLGYNELERTVSPGKSIEMNGDVFAALKALATEERRLGNHAAADAWAADARHAAEYVIRLYDSSTGKFAVGSSVNDVGIETLDNRSLLDAQTFPMLALSGSPEYRNDSRIGNWSKPIRRALVTYSQQITANGLSFRGLSLSPQPVATPDHPNAGERGICWEFVAQTIVAMEHAQGLYNSTEFQTFIDLYRGELRKAQRFAPYANGRGIVSATLNRDADHNSPLPPELQSFHSDFQAIPARVGLNATAFSYFAETSLNPFAAFAGLSLPPGFSPGKSGMINTIRAAGSESATRVILYGGEKKLIGGTPVETCPGQFVDIENANVIGEGIANALGITVISYSIPASAAGKTFFYQAVDEAKFECSNLIMQKY